MYLATGAAVVTILVLLAPVVWVGWWLVAGAGEKVSGRKYTPHERFRS